MKLIDKLMDIDAMLYGKGGTNFINIRIVMDDIDDMILEKNSNAIKFADSMELLHSVLKKVTEIKSDNR